MWFAGSRSGPPKRRADSTRDGTGVSRYPQRRPRQPSSKPLVINKLGYILSFGMDTSQDSSYPQICFEVGLSCEACTAESARQLAQCCKGLRGKMIGQLFVQVYPNPACARMHAHFAECYRAASAGEEIEAPKKFAAVA